MPINPKEIVWDETPQIDANNIVWDSPVATQEPSTVERILRGTALLGKQAYTGLTSIPALAGEAVAAPYNLLAGGIESVTGIPQTRVSPSRALKGVGEALYGDVQPQNMAERLQGDVVTSLGGAAGMMGAGKMLSGVGGSAGLTGAALTNAPAMQYAGAATSGIASGGTREAGGGQGAQLAAGLAGGLLPLGVGLAAGATRGVTSDIGQALRVRKGNIPGHLKEAEKFVQQNAADDPRILEALTKAKTYIPSQKPTSAEALAQYKTDTGEHVGTSLIKIQDNLSKMAGAGDRLKDIGTKRLNNYGKIVENIAGNEAKMKAAIAAREAATKGLYEKADSAIIPIKGKLSDVLTRIPSDAKAEAIKIAKMDGRDFSLEADALTGKDLGYLMKGLKDIAYSNTVTPGVQKSAQNLIKEFDSVLEQVNKPYMQANKLYYDLSSPINRMEVGIVLRDKLKNAAEQDTPMNFLRAADDAAKTIKSATGFSRYDKFSDILKKNEINAIKAIHKDMTRAIEAKSIATKTTLQTGKNIAEQEAASLPPILWRPATIANWILKASNKEGSTQINKYVADILSDPQRAAAVIKSVPKEMLPAFIAKSRQLGAGTIAGMAPLTNEMTQGQQQ